MTPLTASFWRGGTSNGLLIRKNDLPANQDDWLPLISAEMGSPDPYGRQLNGMGGGISSLSKICVVSASLRDDADVEYTFVQVGIRTLGLDTAGNCGNMSSAVGPYALDEGLIPPEKIATSCENGRDYATVKLWNTNTNKIIHSKFVIIQKNGILSFSAGGDYSIDGVSGTASPIALSFIQPGGSKTGKILPSGNASDQIILLDGSSVSVSAVDVANPGVFVRSTDMGITIPSVSAEFDAATMAKIEDVRRRGASLMGLDPAVESVPKVVLVDAPKNDEDVTIRCLAFSMGQAHKAVPLTLALNLGTSSSGVCFTAELTRSSCELQDPGIIALDAHED